MEINFDNKIFYLSDTSENGEVNNKTLFHYKQKNNIVTADYFGGLIIEGHILAVIQDDGKLRMRYHHININEEFKIGECLSTPIILEDGRILLKEQWKWLCDDYSEGYSEIIEINHD